MSIEPRKVPAIVTKIDIFLNPKIPTEIILAVLLNFITCLSSIQHNFHTFFQHLKKEAPKNVKNIHAETRKKYNLIFAFVTYENLLKTKKNK